MANRSRDWFSQAERDLDQAKASQAEGRHEWACFLSGGGSENGRSVNPDRPLMFPIVTRNVNSVSRLVTSGCASRTHTIRPAEGDGNALSSPVNGPPRMPAVSNDAVTVSGTPVSRIFDRLPTLPPIVIVRLRHVPAIDASGLQAKPRSRERGRIHVVNAARAAVGWMLIVATAGFGCRRGMPPEARVTRLRAAYTSAVDIGDLPSLLAHRSLEKDGYRVEPTFFAQPELAVEALASGGADVASGGTRAFWAAVAKGADLVMVMEHSENGYQLVAVPDIARCEDLHGRTLALSSRGSLPTALGEAYLQRCPAAKPRLLILPHSGDRLAALLAGAVDAAVLQRSDFTRLERQAPGRFRPLEAFSAAFPDLDFAGVFVTRRFAQTQRAAVVDYVRERIRANRQVLANPGLLFEEAGRWPTLVALDKVAVEGEVRAPAWTRDGGLTRESVAATLDFFARIGSLPASLTTEQVADFSILGEALQTLEGE